MELEIKNGNYLPRQGGGFSTVDGQQETIQRIMMRLQARRGGFYPLPDFGSRLYTLIGMKRSERDAAARQFVYEALEKEKAEILQVQCSELGSDSLLVKVWLDISGQRVELSMKI